MGKLKLNSLIKLSDEQTILEQHRNKNYVDSVDYKVVKVTEYVEQNKNLLLQVAQLDAENLFIITVEANDGEHYHVIAFVPDAFKLGDMLGGNRQDLLENDKSWIFKEPADVDNFFLSELEFTDSLFNEDIQYVPLFGATLYGSSSENKMFALQVLRATSETKNTEIFILEHGDLEGEVGGYITMFQGAILNDGELEVLK